MYKRILVPVDGSPCSERAAGLACSLARSLGSGLVFTHVLRERSQRSNGAGEAAARSRALASALLERWDRIGGDNEAGACSRLVEGGDVAAVIVQTAHSEGCDLIAMGTHGREGLPRLLLGSVAERVARLSGAPVLLARAAKARVERERSISKILVAVDGSEPSQLALDQAAALARACGAAVEVLHVISEPAPPLDVMGVYLDVGVQATVERMGEAGKVVLRDALDHLSDLNASTSLVNVGQERTGDAIARLAAEQGADLVVLGTHGRTGLDHLLLGSVAERVAHRSSVPTLLVRATSQPASL